MDERLALEKTWREPGGLIGWFSAVDHKTIGLRFIVTAFGFFALAGLLAAVMRLQLAVPNNDLVGADLYNQIFTMHGTTMMFLFAVPVVLGFGIYFVPLLVGARAIAFPRLVAYGYWMFLFGGLFLWVSFALNMGPDRGWFSYVPLAGPEFGIGRRPDVWAQLVTFTETSAIVVAVAIIVTIFKLRAPGMSLNRMPVFVWSELVTAFMTVFAMPAVMVASIYLVLDRLVGTHFYNYAEGGDSLLWQHLFWFFAHPEVYIIFLPAQGMMSMLISTFAGRPIFGYPAIVVSLVATGFIGFGVWVHHMFATGLPQFSTSFFTASSMLITIPTGVQIFCWIATLWSGRVRLQVPLLYALGFFAVFIVGGLSGITLASVPLDTQVHDTFYVVAHLHYVLIGGAVFPTLGAIVYWFPKITGRMMSEAMGRVAFALLFIGFNLTFFPQHLLGLTGMPRRVYTYPVEMGWGALNLLSTIGAVTIFVSLAVYAANVLISLRRGAAAADNPWNAPSLEWATSSPPPPYNFSPALTVSGSDPLWEATGNEPIVVGLSTECREVLVTRVMDAEPDHKKEWPEPSYWPFLTAVATGGMFIWAMFTPWGAVWGSLPIGLALIGWFWPRKGEAPTELQRRLAGGDHPPLEQVL